MLYVLLWWGVGRPPSSSLSCYPFPINFYSSGLWYSSSMPRSVADLLSCWYQWLGKHNSDIWNLVPGCLKWIVWLEQNYRSFVDKEKTLDELKVLCHRSLLNWSRCWVFTDCSSLSKFLSSLNLVSWPLCLLCCLFLLFLVVHHRELLVFFFFLSFIIVF